MSDALESGVNFVAAVVGLWASRLAARPPDAVRQFGHGKAEYVSAAIEGGMVFVAASLIVWTSTHRLVDPRPLDEPGFGLALSSMASLINLVVGAALLRAGRSHRSITLIADGKHLLTDVATSAGVLIGIAFVATGGDHVGSGSPLPWRRCSSAPTSMTVRFVGRMRVTSTTGQPKRCGDKSRSQGMHSDACGI